MINRREFIKAGMVFVGSAAFGGGLLKMLPSPEFEGQFDRYDPDDLLVLFKSELSRYPNGHVAHSFGTIELKCVPNITIYDYVPGQTIPVQNPSEKYRFTVQGISYSSGRNNNSWFWFETTEKALKDPLAMREQTKEICRQTQTRWNQKGIRWGIAPKA